MKKFAPNIQELQKLKKFAPKYQELQIKENLTQNIINFQPVNFPHSTNLATPKLIFQECAAFHKNGF